MQQELTPTQKTQSFFKIIEAGDIALFDIFPEAIAMFGYTKVGKTSSCHIICDSPLCVQDIRGQLMFKPTSKKFPTAKIGFTTQSQTQIPNTFQALLKKKDPKDNRYKFVKEENINKKVWLLDQPGYGDTYGFHRIFSNGYFHYRTFSKTPKLKFILAVSRYDLSGTAEKFKKTISYFINTFNDWEKVKKQIISATSLLITKADVKTNCENLKNIIKSLRISVTNMGSTQKIQYQELIDEFLDNNKIYFIEKPKDIHSKTLQCNILHEIYANSTFWERNILKNNVVDMSDINFSVSNEILKELRDKKKQRFRQDFVNFMQHMDQRKSSIIEKHDASLINIVKTLQQDAVGDNDQRNFLGLMEGFVNDYYKFSEHYKKEREALQINLFKTPQSERWNELSNQDLERQNRNAYFIKKFKVLQFLKQLNDNHMSQIDEMSQFMRSISRLQDFSNMVQVLFKRFCILRTNPKDKVIYRYSYIIQRIIEESKILSLILFTDESIKEEIGKLDLYSPSEDIFRTIQDKFLSNCLGQLDIVQNKKKFIKNMDFNSLVVINPQIINFFESIPNNDDEQTKTRIAEMILEFTQNMFKNQRKPNENEKKFAVSKLYKYRNDFYAYLNILEEQDGPKKSKENITMLIFCLTNSLAQILKLQSLWKESRECYRSIDNVTMIFETYQQEIKTLNLDLKGKRDLYIQYAKQASIYQRKQLGINCAQKAYSLSKKYSELEQAANLIINLSTEKGKIYEDEKNETSEEIEEDLKYLKRFEGFHYCSDFSKDLRDSIGMSFDLQE